VSALPQSFCNVGGGPNEIRTRGGDHEDAKSRGRRRTTRDKPRDLPVKKGAKVKGGLRSVKGNYR
jgi:hypothetical protein